MVADKSKNNLIRLSKSVISESEKKAVYLSVSDKLKPEKTKLIKSDITEVKKL